MDLIFFSIFQPSVILAKILYTVTKILYTVIHVFGISRSIFLYSFPVFDDLDVHFIYSFHAFVTWNNFLYIQFPCSFTKLIYTHIYVQIFLQSCKPLLVILFVIGCPVPQRVYIQQILLYIVRNHPNSNCCFCFSPFPKHVSNVLHFLLIQIFLALFLFKFSSSFCETVPDSYKYSSNYDSNYQFHVFFVSFTRS